MCMTYEQFKAYKKKVMARFEATKREIKPFEDAARVGAKAFSAPTITKDDLNSTVKGRLSVGKKKHRELYAGINDEAFIVGRLYFPYRENLVIEGCHLAHYKWSWKENRAVRVKG